MEDVTLVTTNEISNIEDNSNVFYLKHISYHAILILELCVQPIAAKLSDKSIGESLDLTLDHIRKINRQMYSSSHQNSEVYKTRKINYSILLYFLLLLIGTGCQYG